MSSTKRKEPSVEDLERLCKEHGWTFEVRKAETWLPESQGGPRETPHTDYVMEKDGVRVRFNRRGGGSLSVRLVGWNGESDNETWPGASGRHPLGSSHVGLFAGRFGLLVTTREETVRHVIETVTREKVIAKMRFDLARDVEDTRRKAEERVEALNARAKLLNTFLAKTGE